jgi:hypothetical protein
MKKKNAYLQPIVQKKKAIIIFNSWGTTSMYHTIMDTLFPLWATIQDLHLTQSEMADLTLLNLSPNCDAFEPHIAKLKPLIDAMYGNKSYENSIGGISNSFSKSVATKYEYLVFGFKGSIKLYHYERHPHLLLTYEKGQLFRKFLTILKESLLRNRDDVGKFIG